MVAFLYTLVMYFFQPTIMQAINNVPFHTNAVYGSLSMITMIMIPK